MNRRWHEQPYRNDAGAALDLIETERNNQREAVAKFRERERKRDAEAPWKAWLSLEGLLVGTAVVLITSFVLWLLDGFLDLWRSWFPN